MPSALQTKRVDSLSVSDALIVVATAHRLCEERDSLRKVQVELLMKQLSESDRSRWVERVLMLIVAVFGFVL